MKRQNLITVTLLLLVSLLFIACGDLFPEPEETVTHRVTYYMTNEGAWAGTSNEYIEENNLTPNLTIADLSNDSSTVLDDFIKIYKSVEWYADEAHTTPFDFSQKITKAIKIYGKLTEKDSYTLRFYVGDTLYKTIEVPNGNDVQLPASALKDGLEKQVFWSREKDEWNQYISSSVNMDMDLYAYFF